MKLTFAGELMDIGLNHRCYNALMRAGITTKEQVRKLLLSGDYKNVRNFGAATFVHLCEIYEKYTGEQIIEKDIPADEKKPKKKYKIYAIRLTEQEFENLTKLLKYLRGRTV